MVFATAAPIELTPEVAEATKFHLAAHAAALRGEHAKLAPVQGPVFYLANGPAVVAAKPYLADTPEVLAAKPYLPDAPYVAAAKPYLPDAAYVAVAKPYLPDAAYVAAAKPYLQDTVEVAAAKPYLPDADYVAAAKPYLQDTVDVAAAKVEFQKYFDAAAAGKPVPVAKVVDEAAVVKYAPAVTVPYYYAYPYSAYTYRTAYTGVPVWTYPVVTAPVAPQKEVEVIAEE